MPFEEEVVDAGTKDDRQEESVENVMVSFGFRCGGVIDKAIWDVADFDANLLFLSPEFVFPWCIFLNTHQGVVSKVWCLHGISTQD